MKTNEQENRTEGSFEIPQRRETGIAGPSREVSQRDQMASCTDDSAGREMDGPEWTRLHVKDEPSLQLAEQETKLREPCTGASRESKSTNRKQALVMRKIPLYLIPAALQRGVKEKGGRVYRIGIARSHWNHYTIKTRCNTRKVADHYDQSLHTVQLPHTERLQSTVQSQPAGLTNTSGSSKCGDGS
jgi:hypothetical protein